MFFLVVSFLLSSPSISYTHSSSIHACYMSCAFHSLRRDHSNFALRKSTSYEAPHYAVFSNLPSLHLRSKYSPQHPVLKHTQNYTCDCIAKVNFYENGSTTDCLINRICNFLNMEAVCSSETFITTQQAI
jgi:hypothetical protein